MDGNDGVESERSSEQNKQPNYDLARLKWLDPCNDARFTRKEPAISNGASSEAVLQNIVLLTGEIFDHLSVFEQFSETTSRGATADPKKKLDLTSTRAGLVAAEQELWKVYCDLKDRRQSFVEQQLDSLAMGKDTKGLKVQIGSGGHLLKGWLNIDAGGDDLALNVNWGLPLSDGCASFVYSAHLIEHLRYSDQAPVFVREVHRILAEGGTARFVVPDVRKLMVAYAGGDREFFSSRSEFYPLSKGFVNDGVATLDYILLFCGAAPQRLNYNHKFGYDSTTLCKLLTDAGFRVARESEYQGSEHPELRVDDMGYNAQAKNCGDQHYSLFVEATK
jgi:SAM-dependent methyltransferase